MTLFLLTLPALAFLTAMGVILLWPFPADDCSIARGNEPVAPVSPLRNGPQNPASGVSQQWCGQGWRGLLWPLHRSHKQAAHGHTPSCRELLAPQHGRAGLRFTMKAKTKLITVRVTKEDIRNGNPADCDLCPVALALSRLIGTVEVDGFVVVSADKDRPLPAIAKRFIARFDLGQSVKPFTFRIKVPV